MTTTLVRSTTGNAARAVSNVNSKSVRICFYLSARVLLLTSLDLMYSASFVSIIIKVLASGPFQSKISLISEFILNFSKKSILYSQLKGFTSSIFIIIKIKKQIEILRLFYLFILGA